jgi:hypothetical protein
MVKPEQRKHLQSTKTWQEYDKAISNDIGAGAGRWLKCFDVMLEETTIVNLQSKDLEIYAEVLITIF